MPEYMLAGLLAGLIVIVAWLAWRMRRLEQDLPEVLVGEVGAALAGQHRAMLGDLHDGLARQADRLAEHARADRDLLQRGLAGASGQLAASIEAMTRSVDRRLETLSGHVNERLDEGFRKTNETFTNVMARLATIDEAQKKIDGLTTNVVSLQELLGDKRARGAFGEVQLEALVRNMLPPDSYEFQHTLPNNARVDCALRLPEPTGLVGVDSKFPLENYHRMVGQGVSDIDRKLAQTAFRTDVRRHVDAIASKYIIPDVTSDGAVMFVPAEAVFAEIHAHHPEVVAYAQGRRVWIVSPTTLMAVLNTARAVLKDVETRKQVHVIKDALGKLAKDFARFDERMNALARHIEQASKDVQDVQVSSRKISAHFQKIESAQLDQGGSDELVPVMVASVRRAEGGAG
ncbi:DNA recombination protein RmuC [Aromatoleum buckelii]|uniref:DNA recombination protein RmuC n=1 Tax=Aromatoleum buckelii TaxID=200254 RepID=A0ABX1N4T6_9RHOO|nr:DNA recombination protein RmuC [Aromatoleum buckelii]MCK0511430.1 DNA recombination protein RmuC [Aromatoleum buckelii]